MAERKTFQGIPRSQFPGAQSRTVDALINTLEIITGQKGGGLDRAITFRDVEDGKLDGIISRVAGPGGAGTGDGTSDPGVVESPTAPTNLTALAGIYSVQLTWDAPTYQGHNLTRVFRASADDFGMAVEIATVGDGTNRFIESVEPDTEVWYWIRFVNKNDEEGPINATAGTYAKTAKSPVDEIKDAVNWLSFSALAEDLTAWVEGVDLADAQLSAALDATRLALEAVDAQLADAVADLDARVDSVDTGVAQLAAANAQLDTALADLDARLSGEDAVLAARVVSVEDVSATHAGRLSSLGTWDATGQKYSVIAALEQSTATAASRLSSLGTWDGNDYSRISTLESTTAAHTAAISSLTTRTEDAENTISLLQTTTAEQASVVGSLTTRTEGVENAVSLLQTTTAEQASVVGSLTTRTETVEATIVTVQTTTAEQAAVVSALSTRTELAESSISALQTASAEQASSLSSLTTRTAGAENSITALQTTTGEQATAIASLSTRTDEATSAITALQTTSATQAASITSLTTRVGTAESSITSLQATTSTQASVLSGLTTQVDDAESAISTLQLTVANQATVVNSLSTRVGAAESSVTTLQATTSTQALAIQSLVTSSEDTDDAVAALEVRAQTLEASTGLMAAEYTIKVQAGAGGSRVIAGIGLVAAEGAPSEVIIAADKFAIVSPSFASDSTAYKPFVFDSSRNRVVVENAAIVNLTAEQFIGGQIIADSLAVNQYVALPAGSISTDMLDPSFVSTLVRRNPNAVESGGAWNVAFSLSNTTASKSGVVRGVLDDLTLRVFVNAWGSSSPAFYPAGATMSSFRRLVRFTVQRNGVTITNGFTGLPAVFTAYTRFVDAYGTEISVVPSSGSPGAYLFERLPSLEFLCKDETGDGATHTYTLVVAVRNAGDTANSSLASPPTGTFSGDEAVSSADGVYVAVEWADIQNKPSTATRWPTFAEVTSKPATLAGYGITDALGSSHAGSTGSAHGVATAAVNGFMSAADKAKLDGITPGASDYTHPTSDGSLHVPATGTANSGKALVAGSTAGSFSWTALGIDHISGLQTAIDAKAGLAGATFTNTVSGPRFNATTAFQFNSKVAIGGTNDVWLRLNPANDFTNGIYCGSSVVRTDGELQVGAGGANFRVLSTGEIRSAQNITAYYSDARLKTILHRLDPAQALHEVCRWSKVRYRPNAEAGKYGYRSDRVEVGLLAQDVEHLFPELVPAAPFDLDEHDRSRSGQNYKTLRYERVVTVLAAAIEQLANEVQSLRARAN